MTEHYPGYVGDQLPEPIYLPVEQRHSLLEEPDTGEQWSRGFDAVTVLQKASRLYKANEARRVLNNYFPDQNSRDSQYLYGVIWHFEDDENRSVVMFDTGNKSMHAKLVAGYVLGSPGYGYDVVEETLTTLQHDECYFVKEGNFLTYFKTPKRFQPAEGEVLGMMIGSMRDKVLEQEKD